MVLFVYCLFMGIGNTKIASTIKDQVYEVLKAGILNGELKPGERIQEVQIAEKLEVSRSPVRNAINQLVGEGFLQSIPNKYVCVKQFTVRDINESYEFRLIIEKFAVEKIVDKLDDSIISRLKKFRKTFIEHGDISDMKEYLATDAEFHNYLVEISGNKVIKEALDKVSMMVSPFRVLALSKQNRFYDSIREHTDIIDNLLKKDKAAAVASCDNHLTLAREEILRNIKNNSLLK